MGLGVPVDEFPGVLFGGKHSTHVVGLYLLLQDAVRGWLVPEPYPVRFRIRYLVGVLRSPPVGREVMNPGLVSEHLHGLTDFLRLQLLEGQLLVLLLPIGFGSSLEERPCLFFRFEERVGELVIGRGMVQKGVGVRVVPGIEGLFVPASIRYQNLVGFTAVVRFFEYLVYSFDL